MYCLIILACFISLSTATFDEIKNDIINYYDKSSSIRNMRIVWDDHRQAIEHSLAYAMQETIGKKGLNVYKTKNTVLRLTKSYFQQQGPVGIVLENLDLTTLPHCWLPDAVLSLASNVLKIETILTKMIMSAHYMLMRNESDIIKDVVRQDPFQSSPFLFKQVRGMGVATFIVEGCVLSGYIIAKLKGGKIVLGHDNLKLTKCEYTVEIFNWDRREPPVIARFADQNAGNTLDLNHYILMTLREEFITKLQSALFSVANTSAIFGENLPAYEKEQEDLFVRTSNHLARMVRDMNKHVLETNGGAVTIPDYFNVFEDVAGELFSIHWTDMKITGLDSAYHSFTGGPFKLNDPMIGEQIKFSKLMVTSNMCISPAPELCGDLAVEISDFAINIEVNMNDGSFNNMKTEVAGYRNIELIDVPTMSLKIFGMAYLKNEVAKAVIENIVFNTNTPTNLKLKTNKDGVEASLAMSETGSESDASNFVRLNEYIEGHKY